MIVRNEKDDLSDMVDLHPHCTKYPSPQRHYPRSSYKVPLLILLFFVILLIPLVPGEESTSRILYPSSVYQESEVIRVSEVPSVVIETSDGGLAFILEVSYPDISYHKKEAVVKTDSSGTVQWSRMFNLGSVLLQTKDNGFMLAGCEWPDNLTLVKMDNKGNTEWDRTYPLSCDLVDLIEVSDEGLILFNQQFIAKTDKSGNIQWMKKWEGNPEISSVFQTEDGGYIIAGSKLDEQTQNFWSDICLLKLDAQGVSQWNQSYQITSGEWKSMDWWSSPQCTVFQTSDGGFRITAHVCGYSGPLAWLIDTYSNGTSNFQKMIQWKNILTYDYYAKNTISFLSSDNGFVLVGTINAETNDIILAKTDLEGNLEWEKIVGEQDGHDEVCLVIPTNDQGFVLAWRKWDNDLRVFRKYTAVITKFNAMGDSQWTHGYNIELRDEEWINTLIETSDGGFSLAGLTSSYGSGLTDLWLVRTDDRGTIIWNASYGGAGDEIAESIIQTSDGGFVLVGSSTSYGRGQFDIWLVKTDSKGNLRWNQTYGSPMNEQGYFLEQTMDGGFALVGLQIPTNETGPYSAILVKTNHNGVMEWNQTYSIPYWMDPYQTSFLQTNDGGYIIISTNQLLKLDKDGDIQWNKSLDSIFYYGGTQNLDDYAIESVTQTADNGFLIGTIECPYLGSTALLKCTLVKLDEEGVIQWMKVWGNKGGQYYNFEALHLTDNGILAWLTFDVCDPSPNVGYLVTHIGLDGVSNWNKSFSDIRWRQSKKGNYYSLDSILSTDGAFIVTGYIQYSGISTINTGDSRDAWLAKVDTDGVFLWNKTYGTTGGFNIVVKQFPSNNSVSTITSGYATSTFSSNVSVRGFEIIHLFLGVILLKRRKKRKIKFGI